MYYVPGTATKKEVKDLLNGAAEHLAAEGLLSGDGLAVVDTWHKRLEIDPEA